MRRALFLATGLLLAGVWLLSVGDGGAPHFKPAHAQSVMFPGPGLGRTGIAVTGQGSTATAPSGGNLSLTGLSVAAGNYIIAVTYESGQVGTLTDSNSDTFSKIQFGTTGGCNSGYLWYFNLTTTITSLSYTKQNSVNGAAINALSATGLAASSPVDSGVTASANTTSATPSQISGSPSQTGELFVGGLAGFYTALTTYTQAAGWNTASPFAAALDAGVGLGWLVNPIIQTETYSPTTSVAPGAGASCIGVVGLKHAWLLRRDIDPAANDNSPALAIAA